MSAREEVERVAEGLWNRFESERVKVVADLYPGEDMDYEEIEMAWDEAHELMKKPFVAMAEYHLSELGKAMRYVQDLNRHKSQETVKAFANQQRCQHCKPKTRRAK